MNLIVRLAIESICSPDQTLAVFCFHFIEFHNTQFIQLYICTFTQFIRLYICTFSQFIQLYICTLSQFIQFYICTISQFIPLYIWKYKTFHVIVLHNSDEANSRKTKLKAHFSFLLDKETPVGSRKIFIMQNDSQRDHYQSGCIIA